MPKAVVQIYENLCKGTEGCRICIAFCPRGVLGVSERLTMKGVHPAEVMDIESCTSCKLCMLYCPDLAIVVEEEVAESA